MTSAADRDQKTEAGHDQQRRIAAFARAGAASPPVSDMLIAAIEG